MPEIDPSILASVYDRHPARRMGFDELYAGLERELSAGNVVRTAGAPDGLEIFVYTNKCVYDRNWNLFSLISRGLVVNRPAARVVATPFPKFFNYAEVAATGAVPEGLPFEVTEKVDGSLGIAFEHGGVWRVATKGALASDQAVWASDYLRERCSTAGLDPGTTYLFEIVYPGSRVVVRYGFEGLVLLGAYDQSGDELGRTELTRAAAASGTRLVDAHAYESLEELAVVARALGRDREGFVVRFASGFRMKVKGEEYMRVHRLISRCGPLALWESMMAGDDLAEMRRGLPEEMWEDFDTIRTLLDVRLEAMVAEVTQAAEGVRHLSDKELGLLLQREGHGLSDLARDFVFACRKGDFRAAISRRGKVRDGLFRRMRPDGNRLSGYEPSAIMRRFGEEAL
jgi:RNA ligase